MLRLAQAGDHGGVVRKRRQQFEHGFNINVAALVRAHTPENTDAVASGQAGALPDREFVVGR